eukprot:1179984-Prorocentrum_minimum.AAC.8
MFAAEQIRSIAYQVISRPHPTYSSACLHFARRDFFGYTTPRLEARQSAPRDPHTKSHPHPRNQTLTDVPPDSLMQEMASTAPILDLDDTSIRGTHLTSGASAASKPSGPALSHGGGARGGAEAASEGQAGGGWGGLPSPSAMVAELDRWADQSSHTICTDPVPTCTVAPSSPPAQLG